MLPEHDSGLSSAMSCSHDQNVKLHNSLFLSLNGLGLCQVKCYFGNRIFPTDGKFVLAKLY